MHSILWHENDFIIMYMRISIEINVFINRNLIESILFGNFISNGEK